jgi:hypothetical protein
MGRLVNGGVPFLALGLLGRVASAGIVLPLSFAEPEVRLVFNLSIYIAPAWRMFQRTA